MGRWEAGDDEWRAEIQRGLQGSGLVPGELIIIILLMIIMKMMMMMIMIMNMIVLIGARCADHHIVIGYHDNDDDHDSLDSVHDDQD